jgi:hypothetical protein
MLTIVSQVFSSRHGLHVPKRCVDKWVLTSTLISESCLKQNKFNGKCWQVKKDETPTKIKPLLFSV